MSPIRGGSDACLARRSTRRRSDRPVHREGRHRGRRAAADRPRRARLLLREQAVTVVLERFDVWLEREADTVRVSLAGELDIAATTQLKIALACAEEMRASRIVLDLRALE